MKALIIQALDATSDGYSPDRVVADPDLNSKFVDECRRRGSDASIAVLNRALLNVRKRGALSGRPRAKRTTFPDEEDYRFASEMAVRVLERRSGVSLDDIVCDPELAEEFDGLASSIAPGHTSLQYRWAALNLRKARGLEPELIARVAPPAKVLVWRVADLDLREVPPTQGLYLFFTSSELLYVGEAENLRLRLKKHLDHSDNKGFARWMWQSGSDELRIEVQVLEQTTSSRVRKALEIELIRSRNPIFNVRR